MRSMRNCAPWPLKLHVSFASSVAVILCYVKIQGGDLKREAIACDSLAMDLPKNEPLRTTLLSKPGSAAEASGCSDGC